LINLLPELGSEDTTAISSVPIINRLILKSSNYFFFDQQIQTFFTKISYLNSRKKTEVNNLKQQSNFYRSLLVCLSLNH